VNNYQLDQFIILLKPATKQKQQHMWAGLENNGAPIGRSSNIVTSQSYVADTRINHWWKRSLIIDSTFKTSTAKRRLPYNVSKLLMFPSTAQGFLDAFTIHLAT
jgi:hypothetical protein